MLKTSLSLSVAMVALSGAAFGQDADPAVEASKDRRELPMVSIVGLRPKAAEDITGSVTVLSVDDLAIRDAPYLADQIRAVPGLAVSRSGAAGALTQVRIRGGEANHTLVLLNGIEVSDAVTGETDFGVFSGVAAQRVEVSRGEQSALFGSDAIGGVVNVVAAPESGFRGFLEGGSRSTYRLDAGYGWDFEQGDLSVTVSDVVSDGVDTSGRGGEKDGYQNYSGLVQGGVTFAGDWRANGLLRYGVGEVDTDPDLDFDGRLDNADRTTDSEQWTMGGVVSGSALGLNHLVRANYNSVVRENFADGSLADEAEGERAKFAYSPSIDLSAGGSEITLSGLVDYETEDYRARDIQFGGFTNQDQSFETLGLAAEAVVRIDDLSFNGSLRHDDNDGRFEDASTWRVGAAYEFAFDGRLRASAGAGVKNPTFTELFGFFPGSFIGNPDLTPEESTSWEIGWDQSHGAVDWSLTWFEASLEDEIFTAFNPDFTSTALNRDGTSDRSGVEFAARWAVNDAVSVSGSASQITSENDSGADEIRVPEWTGSLAVNWRSTVKDGLRAGVAFDYVGEQLDTDFGTFSQVELDPYTLVSASIDYPLTDRISATLRGENIFDETVADVFGYNGPGAGVFVGLRIR